MVNPLVPSSFEKGDDPYRCSGMLLVAADTKRICLAWRSKWVNNGNSLGIIGGMCKVGKSSLSSAVDEVIEEVGYRGAFDAVYKAYCSKKDKFSYQNYVGIVPAEFKFRPSAQHAWETEFIEWIDYVDIKQMMLTCPYAFHHGVHRLFSESRELIERICEWL